MINNFSDKYEFLSNFYMTPVYFEGIWYPSSEHAYQSSKTIFPKQRMMILECKTPGQAKRMGSKKSKKITLRSAWDSVRVPTMTTILISKFKNKELSSKLIDTFPHQLIEENHWHDNFWGNCLCDDCKRFHGWNNLGFILTLVRSSLKDKTEFKFEKLRKRAKNYVI